MILAGVIKGGAGRLGQAEHSREHWDAASPSAEQNAFPNVSSLQAGQFSGSPEHDAGTGLMRATIAFRGVDEGLRRRKGTAG